MDQKGDGMTNPILSAKNLVKRYGRVTALDHCDFELYPGEILGVIGDNGAGKSTLIKALCGAVIPDEGEVFLDGRQVSFRSPIEARAEGIETVYQTLAMSPALSRATSRRTRHYPCRRRILLCPIAAHRQGKSRTCRCRR